MILFKSLSEVICDFLDGIFRDGTINIAQKMPNDKKRDEI